MQLLYMPKNRCCRRYKQNSKFSGFLNPEKKWQLLYMPTAACFFT